MSVKLVFSSPSFPGYAGKAIVFKRPNESIESPDESKFELKCCLKVSKEENTIMLNRLFSRRFNTVESIQKFFDEQSALLSPIAGKHIFLKPANILENMVLGGCQIIRLYNEIEKRFIVCIGGKSLDFKGFLDHTEIKTNYPNIYTDLAQKLLSDYGKELDFASVINSFDNIPIEYKLNHDGSLKSLVLQAENTQV